jgi:hypothetical protein
LFGRIEGSIGKGDNEPTVEPKIPIADYDRKLKARLSGLSPRQQAAFAAACAERLFPAYEGFREASGTDDRGLVRRALDLAWEGATTGAVPIRDPAALFEACVLLIPDDEADLRIPPYADDAITAAAYSLQAAAGLDGEAAGWAAQRGTDTLDNFLLTMSIVQGPDADRLVWAHPLVQAEVDRREADLATLDSADWPAAVAEVRSRASRASVLPLDQLDREWPAP